MYACTILSRASFIVIVPLLSSLILRTKDDLRNFKKLVDYGFIGLHGHIRIENMDKFLEFVEKGQDILKELAPMRFEWEIAYSETNNYTEQFYAKEFYNSLEIFLIRSFLDISSFTLISKSLQIFSSFFRFIFLSSFLTFSSPFGTL